MVTRRQLIHSDAALAAGPLGYVASSSARPVRPGLRLTEPALGGCKERGLAKRSALPVLANGLACGAAGRRGQGHQATQVDRFATVCALAVAVIG